MGGLLFVTQSMLDRWADQGRIDFVGNVMTLLAGAGKGRSYALEPAARFLRVACGEADPHGLLEKVKPLAQLRQLAHHLRHPQQHALQRLRKHFLNFAADEAGGGEVEIRERQHVALNPALFLFVERHHHQHCSEKLGNNHDQVRIRRQDVLCRFAQDEA